MTKLEAMLKYVSEHNDFYKKRIKEYEITNPLDITQWPILTRKELQENRYNMFSDGYKSKYFNQQLRRQSSSGSAGIPVNVYWDYQDWYASNMCLWRKRCEWYGIKPSDKYCVFTLNSFGITPENGKLYYINEPSNILSFNVSLICDESQYEQMAEVINGFEPKWLYIQPFVLNKLIHAYKSRNLEPARTIRYIESVGEILSSDLKRRAEEFFKVKVINMYGSEEMNGIAYECPDHHMHILNNNVLIEVLQQDKISRTGVGSCIITNFYNCAMPMIRYEIGDIIQVNNGIVESIIGRKTEIINVAPNIEVNALMLLEIMSNINNQFDGIITSYRYVHDINKNSVICKIGIDSGKNSWFNKIKKVITENIYRRIPQIKYMSFIVEKETNNNYSHIKRKIIEII